MNRLVAAVAITLLSLARTASAWNSAGHMMVAAVASRPFAAVSDTVDHRRRARAQKAIVHAALGQSLAQSAADRATMMSATLIGKEDGDFTHRVKMAGYKDLAAG